MICRGCASELSDIFLDLGESPIANNLENFNNLEKKSKKYPLIALVCDKCTLVQLSQAIPRELLFSDDYVYFSSFSTTWLEHSKLFSKSMINLLQLTKNDLVIEIASNDGYLLQFFNNNQIQVLGIEPAKNVAQVAIQNGIPTKISFFDEHLALLLSDFKKPSLIIGNNVLAHVPNLHSFIKGLSILISEQGLISLEFPHLTNLIKKYQFDTIYHEHYSYLSVTALNPIFTQYGLKIINIEKLNTHGGSLRIYAAKITSNWHISNSVQNIMSSEAILDPRSPKVSSNLVKRTKEIKQKLFSELQFIRNSNKRAAAFGAAAKE